MVNEPNASGSEGWWSTYKDALYAEHARALALHQQAKTIQYYSHGILPGIIQTKAYARAIICCDPWPHMRDMQRKEKLLEVRMKMQWQTLERPDPPTVEVLVDESALHRHIGGREILREQLRHLITLRTVPNLSVLVVPFGRDVQPLLVTSLPFIIFSLPSQKLVYTEDALAGQRITDNRVEVQIYTEAYQKLRLQALEPDESSTLISKIAHELAVQTP